MTKPRTPKYPRSQEMFQQYKVPLERHPTAEARSALTALLGFPDDEQIQDWERFFSNPSRITEFLDLYQDAIKDEDEKFLLMDLILASFSDADFELSESPQWVRCLEILKIDYAIHDWNIWFWASVDEETGIPDNDFTTSPHLQEFLLSRDND